MSFLATRPPGIVPPRGVDAVQGGAGPQRGEPEYGLGVRASREGAEKSEPLATRREVRAPRRRAADDAGAPASGRDPKAMAAEHDRAAAAPRASAASARRG